MSAGEDMRADKGAYEAEEVVSSVAEHLAALKGGEPAESPKPDSDDDRQDLETEEESTPDHDDDSADDDSLDQDADGEETEKESEADDKPAIPENVYRSLVHNDWTPEDIAELYEADPAKAMKVFEKIHQSTNEMSRQFAQLGRSRAAQQPAVTPAQPEQPKDLIDVEALRKRDPDNELLPVVEGLNKALQRLTPAQPAGQPVEQQASHQDQLAIATQVIQFIGADPMKPFGDFYGPAFDGDQMPTYDGAELTPGQRANRKALLDEADAIWCGAQAHGRELTVAEALQKAHNLLTEPMRSLAIRKELVGKVKKRAKGMTLRPSRSGQPQTTDGKPKTEREFEQRTEARLKKLRSKR